MRPPPTSQRYAQPVLPQPDTELAQAMTTGTRGGQTFDVAVDYDRLNRQARRVYDVMRDGAWRTLSEIADETGDPEASVSARLRDFRKPRFGRLIVERQRLHGGTWAYRLLPPT